MTDIFKGATSNSRFIELVDSTTGLPKTGIVYTDVTGSYVRTRSARVAITMATLASASAAFSSGGFILIDDTNQPGVYRVDIPDAAFVTGVDEVVVTIKATGCRTVSRSFDLVNINNQIAYVPNAAADAAGGLPISDAGGLDLDSKLANTNEVTTARMGALTDWIDGGRLDLILDIIAADTTTDIPALIATLQGFVDTEVAAIKAKTDNLPADPADASDIASAFSTVNTKLDTIDGIVDSILVDTNELQTDWANGGRLDLILDARASQTSVDTIDDLLDTEIGALTTAVADIPTNAELATALAAADDAVLAAVSTLQTSINTIDDFLDTEIAAILADTNELQTDWVNGGRLDLILDARSSQSSVDDLPTNAELTTALGAADDAVLTQVALVKAKTDNLPSDPADASVIAASFAALNDVSAAEVADEVRVELASELAMIADIPTNSELATALLPLATQAYIEASILTFVTEAY